MNEPIHWKSRKANDGRQARQARLLLEGVGHMMGGRVDAQIEAAIAELVLGGECRWMLVWRPDDGVKPLVHQGTAACLDTAECCVEKEIAAFGAEIEAWTRLYGGIHAASQKHIGYRGYRQIAN